MMILCALNYDFHILDSVFLVHKPGIKTRSVNATRYDTLVAQLMRQNQTMFIRKVLLKELEVMYGINTSHCTEKFSYRSSKWVKKAQQSITALLSESGVHNTSPRTFGEDSLRL